MLSFCTFTLQSLQCYHIFIIFSVMWTHVRIRFRAQAQHGHENIPETCEVALMWPWSLEKVKGIIFHATCTDFLIFDRVWPSKVSKRIIRPCHFISTCGASSSSISMLHFSKKLILSDSNSLVQEPEMQVTTATLGQHKNTFILRQIRFQWCSMYLCICSFWRYWVKNQCDETFNVTTLMTHTHTHTKRLYTVLYAAIWLWDFLRSHQMFRCSATSRTSSLELHSCGSASADRYGRGPSNCRT